MAETNRERLIRLQQGCDPNEPATETQYVDTARARGTELVRAVIEDRLESRRPGSYMCLPFSGHIGSGKSTELLRAERDINRDQPSEYRFIYVDVETFLEMRDVEEDDIYLGLAIALRDAADDLGVKVAWGYFKDKWEEIKEYATSEVRSGGLDLGHEGSKINLRLQSTSGENRKKIRKALRGEDDTIRKHLNEVLIDLRTKLRAKFGAPNLQTVLMLDGCDKIGRAHHAEEELALFRRLFIDQSATFTELESHVILTMPISPARACAQSVRSRYSYELVTIPSIKVTERDGKTKCEGGYEVFRNVVSRRVPEADWRPYFTPDALDTLIRFSGGYLRGFLAAVESACFHAKSKSDLLPIDEPTAFSAFSGFVQSNSVAMTPSKWQVLAKLDTGSSKSVDPEDPDVQELLTENLILEYVNGEQSTGQLDKFAPWYAVHPVMKELSAFKTAKEALKTEGPHGMGRP